ncbi:MAG TPA: PBP1A family penicillin-binding protein [Longimicrobium sp.]|nr:PBP1A family penicillin-binding protein [Longimicrobium sp.]
MTEPTEGPEPVENLYRKGWFPGVRARWAEAWRTFVWVLRDPGAAAARFPGWLKGEFRKDREFFGALFGGGFRFVDRGLRTPGRRRAILAVVALLAFLVPYSWEMCGLTGCPDVDRLASMQPGGAATVYDARGNEIADLAPVRWAVVDIDRLPAYVPEAFVAVEDQRFYRHNGVDWRRFLGTTARNLMPGGRGQGASTITMQMARNVFPDRLPASERTIKRKVLEIRVAREIERKYGKRDILQTYLNHIYFGEGVYGIQSAARIYFGKNASDLTLAEAALLAGLPKAPTHYNPRRNRERSIQRRNLVLSLMAAQGRITAERAAGAKEAEIRLARWTPERRRQRAPYFVEQVRRVLEAQLGEELYRGLKVHTTLDLRAQTAAEEQVEAQLRAIENGTFGRFRGPKRSEHEKGAPETAYLQGAAVVMDARTGDVKALVGGRSWEESRFDRMMQGFRQPGSAFKPIVFAAAFERGVAPTTKVEDAPIRRELPGGEVWEPRNFDGRFRGPVTVRNALRWSVNTAAVRLAEDAGLDEVRAEARKLGITTDVPRLPSIAIGAAAVRPIELVRAYTPFATLGTRVEPRFVTRVEDGDGKVIWRPKPRRRRVLDAGVAFLVTDLMRDVVDRGTGTRARAGGLTGPAAGKTGTTNGATVAWFVGFTPDVVGAVWIGFDRPRPIVADGSGGELAAPVWGRIVRAARRGAAPEAWEPPPGVVERRVTRDGDRVVAPGCRARGATYEEHFLRGHVPDAVCPRGTATADGDPGWLERQWERARTSTQEWVEEAWSDAWERARRAVGLAPRGAGGRREEAPVRTREEAPGREDETPPVTDTITLPGPEPSLPEVEPEPATEPVVLDPPEVSGPADTITLPPARTPEPAQEPVPPPAGPRDTVRLPT